MYCCLSHEWVAFIEKYYGESRDISNAFYMKALELYEILVKTNERYKKFYNKRRLLIYFELEGFKFLDNYMMVEQL